MKNLFLIVTTLLSTLPAFAGGSDMFLKSDEIAIVRSQIREKLKSQKLLVQFTKNEKLVVEPAVRADFEKSLEKLECLDGIELNCWIGSKYVVDIPVNSEFKMNSNSVLVVELANINQ